MKFPFSTRFGWWPPPTRLWAIGLTLAASVSAAEFWVAPGGDDANPGTRERPLATATKALRLGRELRRLNDPAVAAGLRVILRDGYYELTEPLLVRPEDGGTPESPTVLAAAPGESPVLGGGVTVAGWTRAPDEVAGLPAAARGRVWSAPIPRHNGRSGEFRQLWVDGRKAVRARTPGEGDMARLVAWDRPKREAWIPATTLMPAKLDGVELVLLQMWEIAILRVKFHQVEGGARA